MSDLADRVLRVRLLCDTVNDPYPVPRAAVETPSGPSPSRYVPCETCKGRGRIKLRSGTALCLVCDGLGERRRVAGDDEWDAYIGLPVVEAAQLPVEPSVTTVGLLARREEEQREREGDFSRSAYGWERALRLRDRHGSYRELGRALGVERVKDPRRHLLIQRVLIDHEPIVLSPAASTLLDIGVLSLAVTMRGPIRVPTWVMEQAKADRVERYVLDLVREGLPVREIARRTNLTPGAVRRRIRRNGVDSGGRRSPRSPGDVRREHLGASVP